VREVSVGTQPLALLKDIDPLGSAPIMRCQAPTGKVGGGGGRWFTGALAFTGQVTGVYGGYRIPVDAVHSIPVLPVI
jgi:hypothetical protein